MPFPRCSISVLSSREPRLVTLATRFPPMLLRAVCIAFVATAIVSPWAVTARASDVVPSAAAGVAPAGKAPRLVVMHGGRVVEGRMRTVPGGYEVESAGGRVFLADSFIWYTAESREDAYKTLRERIPYASADAHVWIAQWCIDNGVHSAAQDELRLALRLEPNHADARTMLQLLAKGDAGPGGQTSRATVDDFENPTLGGLPHETARTFVTRVQPLLVNRCGNTSCHGTASQNAFSLRNIRSGSAGFRSSTQQNLDAVRRYLSPESPATSPLLVEPQRPGHGGSRKPLFVGPAGEAQLRILAAWVAEVSRTAPPVTTPFAAESGDRLVLTSAVAEQESDTMPTSKTSAAATTEVRKTSPATVDPTADLLQSVIRDQRPDAFDPEAFNRRFAPRRGDSPLSSSDGPMR